MSDRDKKDKNGVSYESNVPLETALEYLKSIVSRLEGGEMHVSNGSSEIVLVPSGTVDLQVKARRKDGRQSFRFELSWEGDVAAPAPASGLTITGPSEPHRARARK